MTARNIEIKARLKAGQRHAIRQKALAMSEHGIEELRQTDTFFFAPRGRLKLREFSAGSAQLIAYSRSDEAGPKLCCYVIHACDDPRSLRQALSTTLGIRGEVKKHRQVILIGQTRLHLDCVEGLGEFLELEVVLSDEQSNTYGESIAQELLSTLHIQQPQLVDVAYIDLLERPCGAAR